MQGYYKTGNADDITCLKILRPKPYGSTCSVMCRIERALDYGKNFSFTADDIAYP
jgi:hypothetical protein